MIKKIIISLCLLIGCSCLADNLTCHNNHKMPSFERRKYVVQIKQELFSKDFSKSLNTKEFKDIIKKHLKDLNYPDNYYAAQSGYTYYKNNYLSVKITSRLDIAYEYSVQEQNNMRIIYCYSMLGNLKSVDIIYGNYPNYPYFSRKYSKSGKFLSATYYLNSENVFEFNSDGEIINN